MNMASHNSNMTPLKIVSWNINSFRKRCVDALQYILDNKIDVLCLQETGTDDTFNPRVSGYCRYTIECNQGRRGLITYVKNTIPVKFYITDFGRDCECIRAKLFFKKLSHKCCQSIYTRRTTWHRQLPTIYLHRAHTPYWRFQCTFSQAGLPG